MRLLRDTLRRVLSDTFDLDSEKRRIARYPVRLVDHFNGVHRFRFHPLNAPPSGMQGAIDGRLIPYIIWSMVSDMWCDATFVPAEKKAGPTMVMHRFSFPWRWDRDFEHSDQSVFEDHFVTIRSSLNCVVTVRETGIVLSERNTGRGDEEWENGADCCEKSSSSRCVKTCFEEHLERSFLTSFQKAEVSRESPLHCGVHTVPM